MYRTRSSDCPTIAPVTPRVRLSGLLGRVGWWSVPPRPARRYQRDGGGVRQNLQARLRLRNRLPSATEVIAQLPGWFTDYHEIHPHKGLGMRSPREYLRAVSWLVV